MDQENYKDQRIFTDAIQFAVECHSGAFRKGTDIPYIVHPMEVAAIVSTMTADPNVLAAAVLHDVVEDAGIERETIREKFNDAVADLVAGESEDKRPELPPEETWKIRKQEAIKGLEQAGIEAKMIALGDKLSNARAIYRDYRKLGDEVWQRFNQKDPSQQKWYYRSFTEVFEPLHDFDAYQEYKRLVEDIFK